MVSRVEKWFTKDKTYPAYQWWCEFILFQPGINMVFNWTLYFVGEENKYCAMIRIPCGLLPYFSLYIAILMAIIFYVLRLMDFKILKAHRFPSIFLNDTKMYQHCTNLGNRLSDVSLDVMEKKLLYNRSSGLWEYGFVELLFGEIKSPIGCIMTDPIFTVVVKLD